MTDNTSAEQALAAEIAGKLTAIGAYLNTLDAPTLLGEIRCLLGVFGRAAEDLAPAHPTEANTIATVAHLLGVGIQRFDAATPVPLPEAVAGVTPCRCHAVDAEENPGVMARVQAYHLEVTELLHQAAKEGVLPRSGVFAIDSTGRALVTPTAVVDVPVPGNYL